MKKKPPDFQIFLSKASEDEQLLLAILNNQQVSDAVFGFHAQQAAEKLMKSVLAKNKIPFSKTHDLTLLLDIMANNKIRVPVSEDELLWLVPYATILRYDEISEEEIDRPKALMLIQTLKSWAIKTTN